MRFQFGIYRQIVRLLRGYPALFLSILVFSLLNTLSEGIGVSLVIPLLEPSKTELFNSIPIVGELSSVLNAMSLASRIRFVAVALVLIILSRNLLSIALGLLSLRLDLSVQRDLQKDIFQQLHEVELSFIHRRRIGSLLTDLGPHVLQSQRLIEQVMGAIPSLFSLAIYAILMLLISVPLTLGTMSFLFGLILVNQKLFSARLEQSGQEARKLRRELKSISIESLSGMKQLHLFGREGWSVRRFEATLEAYEVNHYYSRQLIYWLKFWFNFLVVSMLSLPLLVGSFLTLELISASVGQILLLLIIVFRLMGPALSLNQLQSQVTNLAPAFLSLLDLLCREDKPYLQNGTRVFDLLKEGISFQDVTFRYGNEQMPVLQNVTFEIPCGKMTALVGRSGAGKSTLANLMARLYDVEAGQICVDGIPLQELDLKSWRSSLACVTQDIFIFNDSVRENLRFAWQDASDEEIYHAAQLAQAHDFIMALPQGYDTLLGDRGVRLSGGQQQRLTIARALLSNPQLLIFDEATSHLDSENERAIQAAISDYAQGRTLLVIAHRLSTIRDADHIVVLEKGRVVEQGTYKELMALHGHYWRLIQAQSPIE